MNAVSKEVGNKIYPASEMDEPLFHYQYGYSLIMIKVSFLLIEVATLFSVVVFMAKRDERTFHRFKIRSILSSACMVQLQFHNTIRPHTLHPRWHISISSQWAIPIKKIVSAYYFNKMVRPSRHMLYLEDIIELIEDVPEELQKRGAIIQEWERQAYEYKSEADRLTARLDKDISLTEEDKARVFFQIAERMERAREATKKKVDLAAKCHRLVEALYERVKEYAYHCKLELEVDAPGCTEATERTFVNEALMMAAAALNTSDRFLAPNDRSYRETSSSARLGGASLSTSRESTPTLHGSLHQQLQQRLAANVQQGKRSRGSSVSSSRSNSVQPEAVVVQRKRKRDRDAHRNSPATISGSSGTASMQMSAYMRKKKEKEREEKKLREVHAMRERSQGNPTVKQEPIDDYDTEVVAAPIAPSKAARGPGRPSRESRALAAACLIDSASARASADSNAASAPDDAAAGGGMSDEDDDLMKFLLDEMPAMGEHSDLLPGMEDENLFDMAEFGAGLGKELEKIQQAERPPSPLGLNAYGTLNAPTKSSASTTAARVERDRERRRGSAKPQQQHHHHHTPRPNFVFGTGESMHGRPRKLTNRAEEMISEIERKEKQRRQRDEEDDVDDTLYCYCQKPSDGTMLACDGEECEYKWFHLSCLNMASEPDTEVWFCPDCSKMR